MTMIKRQLSQKFELYIPTKARDSAVEKYLAQLTRISRGMTAIAVQGGYVPENTEQVLLEGVVIYTFYAGPSTYNEIDEVVSDIAWHLLREKGEESVLVTVSGEAFLCLLEA